MPLWKVYHPVGAYSVQDKKAFAEKVTEMYSRIPIPKFYVVMIFDTTKTARELYDRMLELYPDRANPGSLWSAAAVAKTQL